MAEDSMPLIDKIRHDLNQALKSSNEEVVRTLRFLLSEVHNLTVAKYPPEKGGLPEGGLPDQDIIAVIQKLVKTHKESIEAFKKGQREDLVKKEEAELEILNHYLPRQLSYEEIRKKVEECQKMGIKDFGQMMREVMAKVKGQAEGGEVAKIVKEVLGE